MPRLVIQFLVPLITHSSPSLTRVVFMPAGAEPASGSDRAKAGDHSPVAHLGRKRPLRSSLPNSWIGSVPSSCTIRIRAQAASTLAISSSAMFSISVPVPVPPFSLGNGCPRMTCSASALRLFRRLVDLSRARADPLACYLSDRGAEVEVLLRDRVDGADHPHAVDPSDEKPASRRSRGSRR